MSYKSVHLVGIGGINMSGVAKLLKRSSVTVTGSDTQASEATAELEKLSIKVTIGQDAKNVPADCELVIYSSAVPELNPERAEARRRMIPQLTNFEFLGQWTQGKRTVLVTGTHGKSTTTAMLALMLEAAGKDPTVIIGSRVPSFPDGNFRSGSSQLVLIEGDEYAKHFLEFTPSAVIINNIELDHTDVFQDENAMIEAFRELLEKVLPDGIVVANADDRNVQTLIGKMRSSLEARNISILTFGFGSHASLQIMDHTVHTGEQVFSLRNQKGLMTRYRLTVPGRMNVMNVAGALTMASAMKIETEALQDAVESYHGIWRRFQIMGEQEGVTVVSDYGHHPTAVTATLDAAKAFYPGRRIVLCFQPHHRNRTKHLFQDFVSCFDRADALLLVEIYDVAGREADEDSAVSSQDLLKSIYKRDEERNVSRPLEFAANPAGALELLKRWKRSGDLILVMGAGDIYKIADQIITGGARSGSAGNNP